jgi:cysteine desulfurase
MASFSAHKAYGPKGVGAFYIRRGLKIKPQAVVHGGGHEKGMRSGTLPTHQIVGMGEAFALSQRHLADEMERISRFKARVLAALQKLGGIIVNGDQEHCCPGILNVSVEGVDGETLLMNLYNLAVSSGSACNSASVEPSFVLSAMGVSRQLGLSAVRISIGRFTTSEEIDYAIAELESVIARLRDAV